MVSVLRRPVGRDRPSLPRDGPQQNEGVLDVDSIGSRTSSPVTSGRVEPGRGGSTPRTHRGEPVLQFEQHRQPGRGQQRPPGHLHDRVDGPGSPAGARATRRRSRYRPHRRPSPTSQQATGRCRTTNGDTAHLEHASEMAALRDRLRYYAGARLPPAATVGSWTHRRHSEPVKPRGEPSLIRHQPELRSQTGRIPCPTTPPPAPAPAACIRRAASTATSAAAELQQLLLATEDITDFLDELATLAAKVLPGDLFCGITMRRDRGATTVASSDTRASQVDEIQYGHHQGPCLHSLDTGDRWSWSTTSPPTTGGAPTRCRLWATASAPRCHFPCTPTARSSGPSTSTPPSRTSSGHPNNSSPQRFADEASRALALAVRLAEHAEMSQHLQNALASRAVIDQALGIIMGQNRCTADEAFDLLRTISQNRNIKLRDIAAELITAVSGQPPASEPRFS